MCKLPAVQVQTCFHHLFSLRLGYHNAFYMAFHIEIKSTIRLDVKVSTRRSIFLPLQSFLFRWMATTLFHTRDPQVDTKLTIRHILVTLCTLPLNWKKLPLFFTKYIFILTLCDLWEEMWKFIPYSVVEPLNHPQWALKVPGSHF